MKKMEAVKNNLLRGRILKTLNAEYPDPVELVVLRVMLEAVGCQITDRELTAQVSYLAEAGYCKHEVRKGENFDVSWAQLTKAGMMIVAEMDDDKAVTV